MNEYPHHEHADGGAGRGRRRAFGRAFAALLPLLLLAGHAAQAQGPQQTPPRDTQSDTWVATDGLGRALPTRGGGAPAPRAGRTVGIFYFLWQARRHDPGAVYDISRLLAADPAAPAWGPEQAFHWWAEPHLGYYYADDPAVIRRHAQMLSDAGVDVIVCDVTNAITYPESYLAVCRVFEQIRREGGRTPQIAFLTHAHGGETAQRLFDEFYNKGLHRDLWFRWKGKPLLLADPDELTPALRDFFTVRESWAWSDPKGWFGDGRDRWPWVDHTPQRPGWHESPGKPEQVSVSTAQHATTNIGRSHRKGAQPPPGAARPAEGVYFAEQWGRALAVDPAFVFVTGWNEWIAQRFVSGPDGGPHFLGRRLAPGETFFVDQFSPEFSRDIEPMRADAPGSLGDAFYYQLAGFVRRYKGVRANPRAGRPKTIRVAGPFSQWANVAPEFRDDRGDAARRNHPGWGGAGPYVETSGRNDVESAKVARDARNLYFLVRCAAPLSPPEASGEWMTLLLDADGRRDTGWEGCEFAVRRVLRGGRPVTALCRSVGTGGRWQWEPVRRVEARVAGREMHLSVPRALLGLPAGGPLRLDFQWIDNVPVRGGALNPLDLLDKGDAAPNGRFRFRFEE